MSYLRYKSKKMISFRISLSCKISHNPQFFSQKVHLSIRKTRLCQIHIIIVYVNLVILNYVNFVT